MRDLMQTVLNYLHKFWSQFFVYRKDGDYTIDNLDILTAGKVDALVASPLYEEGYLGLALIDNMMHGRVYNLSEGLWWQELDNCIIRKDGEGITGPAYYYDLFTRAQTRFGPAASLDSIG